ncbi:hypothetical protein ACH4FX_41625 [Streptomyces sp. NPDC018019]|uniref:hypothetical protein n=1 Tax=Streptomyces sp. NPDC018019 TaxID=3365030 RepID=UPI0037AE0ED0
MDFKVTVGTTRSQKVSQPQTNKGMKVSDFQPKDGRQPTDKKNRRIKWGIDGSLAAVMFVAAVSGCESGGKSDKDKSTASTAASMPAEASHKAAPAPTHKAQPITVLALTGSGTKNTSAFKVGDEWTLSYTFDCGKAMHAVAGKGNFIVFDKNDKIVNQLDKSGKGSTQQHTPGTRRLQIISECDWTVKVTD